VERQTVSFQPHLVMNDYADLNTALMAGTGIGDLLPVVQPALLREGWLVEVMSDWLFRTFSLSLVHLGGRQISRPVPAFKEFAVEMSPKLFPVLPT
jgi:DNA-binding transcriptional LysR family regulator